MLTVSKLEGEVVCIDRLHPGTDDPSVEELEALTVRAKRSHQRLSHEKSEARLPLFVEFAGSPKSGKSTIIGRVAHFLKRSDFRVSAPAEGVSLRTPRSLKDDLLAFNAWSASYALQIILEDAHAPVPDQVVLLDRGLFDATVWMKFLEDSVGRITSGDRKTIHDFLTLDLWRDREVCVFVFLADSETSMQRETHGQLTGKSGKSAMRHEILDPLRATYERMSESMQDRFANMCIVDTSFVAGKQPSFQRIALDVANRLLDVVDHLTIQNLLVTPNVDFEGFLDNEKAIGDLARKITHHPKFLEKEAAEASRTHQQIVPYGLIRNQDGKYLSARRKANGGRKELSGKHTILVGGHAEQKDLDPAHPDQVFARCLRREIEEELIGLHIKNMTPKGFIHDVRNDVGRRHLAFLHEVEVGGSAAIRRQTVDQEFGREPTTWKSPAEIKAMIADLDPWSQLVASRLFGAVLPDSARTAPLFRDDI